MAATFQFVTITDASPSLSAEHGSLIKRHVMRDIGFARRRYRPSPTKQSQLNKTSLTTEILFVGQEASTPAPQDSWPPENGESDAIRSRSSKTLLEVKDWAAYAFTPPCSRLGLGKTDPFQSLPVPMNMETDSLVRYSMYQKPHSWRLGYFTLTGSLKCPPSPRRRSLRI